ncbi:MAG: AAA family ATPase [Acutalibacteraceae bacterium]|nr:AAA family ATPase [Acutalibacteraceae bacterium]
MNKLFVRQISIEKELPRDNYISKLPVVKSLVEKPIDFKKPVTFFVGENGVGKSTLIEALAIALDFNAEGGSRNFCFSTEDSHSALSEYLTVAKGPILSEDGYFLRAESFYNVATHIDELDRQPCGAPFIVDGYGGTSLHKQSHGESFMRLVEERFGGNGIYILDEPEAALSPMRLLRLMSNIKRLVEKNSQFIISTHSPILMAFPDADIFEIKGEEIVNTPFEETEHYRVTKNFLDNPQRTFRHLFED